MKGGIWAAYASVDMSKPCPDCGALANSWCTNEITGRVRRAPCLARISEHPNPTTSQSGGGPDIESNSLRDFSEPLYVHEPDLWSVPPFPPHVPPSPDGAS